MGERKVLNKYFPPDFDPSKLPRNRQKKDRQIKVRVMLPFTAQCQDCGNWIMRGTKFNARKEEALGEAYLGIAVWRFYIRCGGCSREIVFKTDPKNQDYVCEVGANRNFEPWRQVEKAERLKMIRVEEEEEDAMKALENRTLASKREMDVLDALEEVMQMNSRQQSIDTEALLKERHAVHDEDAIDEEDDDQVDAMFNSAKKAAARAAAVAVAGSSAVNDAVEADAKTVGGDYGSKPIIKRLDDDEEADVAQNRPSLFAGLAKRKDAGGEAADGAAASEDEPKQKKQKKKDKKKKKSKSKAGAASALALVGNYSSDDST